MKLSILLFLLMNISCANSGKQHSLSKPGNNFAVVELFTSEGCSSCPSADRLLSEIHDQYSDSNVLVLAYHVDYWDRLGWKDPFSSSENTERQNYYANIFGISSIYTPQALVNGKKEFVGSDKKQLLQAINSAPTMKKSFVLTAEQKESDKIFTSVRNIELRSGENMIIALVQKHATTHVGKGENEGKELTHVNIVRQFSIQSGNNISTTFNRKDIDSKQQFFVAAFIQNKNSGEISGFQTCELKEFK